MNNNFFTKNTSTISVPINDKYNPDVVKKFKEMSTSHNNRTKPEFVNNYYKSITNQPIKQTIKSSNDLKLEIDKPNTEALLSSYDAILKERLSEQNTVIKSIAINNNVEISKQNISNIDYPEIITKSNFKQKISQNKQLNKESNVNLLTENIQDQLIEHNLLKSEFTTYVLKDNDKLLNEKKRFNKILEDLDSIL